MRVLIARGSYARHTTSSTQVVVLNVLNKPEFGKWAGTRMRDESRRTSWHSRCTDPFASSSAKGTDENLLSSIT